VTRGRTRTRDVRASRLSADGKHRRGLFVRQRRRSAVDKRIERGAWRDLAAAAPPDFAAQVGLEMHELGDALMLMTSRVPAFPFNWLSGAELDGADADAIPAAVPLPRRRAAQVLRPDPAVAERGATRSAGPRRGTGAAPARLGEV
jgi:hypothetical protein